ncbi:MAG TPA: PspA/IM30 family protein [Polyangiales bacterium]|nr:PspA/IM30 family protein [Polyangiales bacterium]
MSIFDRFKTTLKADAHGVIDALEDRALLLRQYLRDAEAELARKRGQLQALELDQRTLERDQKRAASQLLELESGAELALRAGNDELARHTLKRLLALRARTRRQHERSEELATTRRELEQKRSEQAERYELMKERVSAELARSGAGCELDADVISDEQVELELLRRKAASEVTS